MFFTKFNRFLLSLIHVGNELYKAAPVVFIDFEPMFVLTWHK